ncbi:MAG: insulinase family protein [Thermoguttaceae bacterium]|nr:insulinase family protein [Thermoguttaceae bacterium]
MTEAVETRLLDNGLVLLTERIAETEAAAYSFHVPYGTVDEPEDRPGLAGMITEMIVRGAGDYNNRQLLEAFEKRGIDASETAQRTFSAFGAVLVADKLNDSLALTADILRRPHFPEEELEPSRQVLLQELAGVEDEPGRILARWLSKLFFPAPWGRFPSGEVEGVQAITLDDVVETYKKRYSPNGAILCVAGKIDPDAVAARAESLFGDWTGPRRELPDGEKPSQQKVHIPFDSAQTHLGIAWPAVCPNHGDFLPLRIGISALSGGMSSRLFDQVREKRGLCYSVSASYIGSKKYSAGCCSCASGSDTAQEALDVILAELRRLSEGGITQSELDRCKICRKSSMVMSQESTVSRIARMAAHYDLFGRVRSLQECLKELDDLTLEEVNQKIAAHPIGPFRLATLGPEELEIDPALLG